MNSKHNTQHAKFSRYQNRAHGTRSCLFFQWAHRGRRQGGWGSGEMREEAHFSIQGSLVSSYDVLCIIHRERSQANGCLIWQSVLQGV